MRVNILHIYLHFLLNRLWDVWRWVVRQTRGFKALKQTVKLHYRLANFVDMMNAYREMLTYIKFVFPDPPLIDYFERG